MNPLEIILGLGTSIIERLFPDPAQAAEAKLKLLELQQTGALAEMTAQTNINAVEAANPSVFVSGWRPFFGWICSSAVAMQYLIGPLLSWLTNLAGHPITFPPLDMNLLLPILGGMLGLRTWEKVSGVASK